jgi:diketogulonate reductase-like aldo/keto reductase
MEAYQCLEEHHRKGIVGHLGISNIYDPDLLRYIIQEAEIKPTVVQNRYVFLAVRKARADEPNPGGTRAMDGTGRVSSPIL